MNGEYLRHLNFMYKADALLLMIKALEIATNQKSPETIPRVLEWPRGRCP